MAEPDFRQLDADAGGDSLPQNRHFFCHSVALAPQREITKVFPCREQHIDYVPMTTSMPFDLALMAYLNKRAHLG